MFTTKAPQLLSPIQVVWEPIKFQLVRKTILLFRAARLYSGILIIIQSIIELLLALSFILVYSLNSDLRQPINFRHFLEAIRPFSLLLYPDQAPQRFQDSDFPFNFTRLEDPFPFFIFPINFALPEVYQRFLDSFSQIVALFLFEVTLSTHFEALIFIISTFLLLSLDFFCYSLSHYINLYFLQLFWVTPHCQLIPLSLRVTVP